MQILLTREPGPKWNDFYCNRLESTRAHDMLARSPAVYYLDSAPSSTRGHESTLTYLMLLRSLN